MFKTKPKKKRAGSLGASYRPRVRLLGESRFAVADFTRLGIAALASCIETMKVGISSLKSKKKFLFFSVRQD